MTGTIDPALRALMRKVLTDWGLDVPTADPPHGWRCQYPALSDPETCGHVDALVNDLALAAAEAAPLDVEGYWEKAYWEVVPKLQKALDAALRSPDTETAERPYINEYGRAECVCGISVLPQNWANHLESQQRGPHRAAWPDTETAGEAGDGL